VAWAYSPGSNVPVGQVSNVSVLSARSLRAVLPNYAVLGSKRLRCARPRLPRACGPGGPTRHSAPGISRKIRGWGRPTVSLTVLSVGPASNVQSWPLRRRRPTATHASASRSLARRALTRIFSAYEGDGEKQEQSMVRLKVSCGRLWEVERHNASPAIDSF